MNTKDLTHEQFKIQLDKMPFQDRTVYTFDDLKLLYEKERNENDNFFMIGKYKVTYSDGTRPFTYEDYHNGIISFEEPSGKQYDECFIIFDGEWNSLMTRDKFPYAIITGNNDLKNSKATIQIVRKAFYDTDKKAFYDTVRKVFL